MSCPGNPTNNPSSAPAPQTCVYGEGVHIYILYNHKYCSFALGQIDSRPYTLEEMFNELNPYFL